ncbi:MAG: hypothetical protein V3V03_09880 [Hyphomonadaceae bacterium]
MTETPHTQTKSNPEDEKRAIRFLVIKVGFFLLIPPIAAGIALWVLL